MKANWVEELSNVLWAYQTTPKRSVGETLFSMTYDIEAVIPIKISSLCLRITGFTQSHNDECMFENLDTLEERRDVVSVWLADYQQKLAQGYNRRVRPRELMLGDLFLQLALNWEGPYRVIAMGGAGAYYLEDMEERPLPRP